nr:hypothetical protein TorRG33x02_180150 [Ipomoea batatas]
MHDPTSSGLIFLLFLIDETSSMKWSIQSVEVSSNHQFEGRFLSSMLVFPSTFKKTSLLIKLLVFVSEQAFQAIDSEHCFTICRSFAHVETDSQLLTTLNVSFHDERTMKLRKASAFEIRFPGSRSSFISRKCAAHCQTSQSAATRERERRRMEGGRRMGGWPSRRREAAPLTATARDPAPPSLRIFFSPNHRHNSRHHHGENHRTSSLASHEENGKRTASSQEPASPLTLFSLRSPSTIRRSPSPVAGVATPDCRRLPDRRYESPSSLRREASSAVAAHPR